MPMMTPYSALGCKMSKLCVKTLIGGTSVSDNIKEMKANTSRIIIGSPGRVYDLLQGNIITTNIYWIINWFEE